MRLGIDFGTTHTVVASCDRGNYPVVGFADAAGDVRDFFPSLVAARAGVLRYGWAAAEVARDPEWTLVRSFKRLLAGEGAHAREVAIGDTRIALPALVAGYLRALRAALPATVDDGGAPEVVVAVPANAHTAQRFLTLEAFREAGFVVRGLVNEPSAAGFEYTHRHGGTVTRRRDRIVVYDLGGGTFDASLVRVSERRHEVLATAGVARLGGDDFDAALAELVRAQLGVTLAPAAAPRLLERCREAKESLTPSTKKLHLDLEDVAEGADAITVAVADYYEAARPLVERTLAAMEPVMGRLGADEAADEPTTSSESTTPDDLAGIYVVGGASALPLVGRILRERWGRRVHRSPYPFAAVAIGLAIAADEDAGYTLEDRLSRHLGVFREAQGGRELAFDPILAKDAALPARGDAITLTRRYRATHNVGHYRFVECDTLDGGRPGGEITPLAEVLFPFDGALRTAADLRAVPVRRTDGGPLVEETYTVDASGLVTLTMADLESGFQRAFPLGR